MTEKPYQETILDIKVREACHRIEELYNETNGRCYVSFSGGKDSTVLLALIKMCIDVYTLPAEGIKAVYSETGLELGATQRFVRWCKKNWYQNIEIIRPEHSFDWCVKNYGKPMKSKLKSGELHRWRTTGAKASYLNLFYGKTLNGKSVKSLRIADKDMHLLHPDFEIIASPQCCKVLKKNPFKKYEKENNILGAITGLRIGEGGARELNATLRVKNGGKLCTFTKRGVIYKMPIIDWTNEETEQFINDYNVPLSEAYTKQGYDRTGCFLCPFSLQIADSLTRLYEHEPNRYKAAMHWLKDVYIAQDIKLPFDEEYELDRVATWRDRYEPMRQEMLRKYRPNSRLIKGGDQWSIFDYEHGKE